MPPAGDRIHPLLEALKPVSGAGKVHMPGEMLAAFAAAMGKPPAFPPPPPPEDPARAVFRIDEPPLFIHPGHLIAQPIQRNLAAPASAASTGQSQQVPFPMAAISVAPSSRGSLDVGGQPSVGLDGQLVTMASTMSNSIALSSVTNQVARPALRLVSHAGLSNVLVYASGSDSENGGWQMKPDWLPEGPLDEKTRKAEESAGAGIGASVRGPQSVSFAYRMGLDTRPLLLLQENHIKITFTCVDTGEVVAERTKHFMEFFDIPKEGAALDYHGLSGPATLASLKNTLKQMVVDKKLTQEKADVILNQNCIQVDFAVDSVMSEGTEEHDAMMRGEQTYTNPRTGSKVKVTGSKQNGSSETTTFSDKTTIRIPGGTSVSSEAGGKDKASFVGKHGKDKATCHAEATFFVANSATKKCPEDKHDKTPPGEAYK